jgi:Spy/CpxP family protein refolding chaperone
MKKMLSLFVVALSLVFSQAQACMSEEAHERVEKMVSKLDLTKEQRDKIHAIRAETKQKVMPLREKLRDVRHQVNEAFKTNSMNSFKESGFVREEKDVIGSMIKVRMDERVAIHNVLNEKQRMKFANMMEEWKKEHHMKKEHHKKKH